MISIKDILIKLSPFNMIVSTSLIDILCWFWFKAWYFLTNHFRWFLNFILILAFITTSAGVIFMFTSTRGKPLSATSGGIIVYFFDFYFDKSWHNFDIRRQPTCLKILKNNNLDSATSGAYLIHKRWGVFDIAASGASIVNIRVIFSHRLIIL